MTEKTISLVFTLIIILSVFSLLINILVPINMKLNLDQTCKDFYNEFEIEGYLKEETQFNLRGQLQRIGLNEVEIIVPDSKGKKGQDIIFFIRGKIQYKLKIGLFEIKESIINYSYKRTTKARRIIN